MTDPDNSADPLEPGGPLAVGAEDLGGLSLFAPLTTSERSAIAHRFQPVDIDPGEVVFFEGEAPNAVYIVTAGRLKLVKHSEDGRDVVLHLALPGDLIGGVSAFGRRPHTFTAQALVRSRVLRTQGPDFAEIMEKHPAVARVTLAELIERLTDAHEGMKSLAVERVERRIARQVLKLGARVGEDTADGRRINVPLTRQDIADFAGTTVETAIRVLSRWRKQGIVRTVDGHLVVRDWEALEAIV